MARLDDKGRELTETKRFIRFFSFIVFSLLASSVVIGYVSPDKAETAPMVITSEENSSSEKVIFKDGSMVESSTQRAVTYGH